MTHEELIEVLEYTAQDGMADEPVLKALRAVVELHQRIWTFPPGSNNSTPICLQCREGDFEADYPCPTIQAIEKELG